MADVVSQPQPKQMGWPEWKEVVPKESRSATMNTKPPDSMKSRGTIQVFLYEDRLPYFEFIGNVTFRDLARVKSVILRMFHAWNARNRS